MILTLYKEQTGKEFIKEMEKTHNSIDEMTKKVERTNNMMFYSDLEAWKYYLNNPNETIKRTTTLFTDDLILSNVEIKLLSAIKHDKPNSIRELAKLLNKDISTIHPKVKTLEKEGLLKLKDGVKNSKIPVLNYDKIEIAI
jgi:predicted HTH transcriptional regulator